MKSVCVCVCVCITIFYKKLPFSISDERSKEKTVDSKLWTILTKVEKKSGYAEEISTFRTEMS